MMNYFETRFTFDRRREILWHTLAKNFFQKLISSGDNFLELGCGYCDFINSIRARNKIGIDIWSDAKKFSKNKTKVIVTSATKLKSLKNNYFDFVFASNIFEHLTQEEFKLCLKRLKPKMKKKGLLVILQPNFRLAYRRYFDDYTHKSIWTDESLTHFLIANDFNVVRVMPRFLPLSIKSKIPIHPILIRLYLISPIKIFAQQMLVIATPNFND
jgi:ubiquinone/menaquinone biosynthesis C-methylase UbiE